MNGLIGNQPDNQPGNQPGNQDSRMNPSAYLLLILSMNKWPLTPSPKSSWRCGKLLTQRHTLKASTWNLPLDWTCNLASECRDEWTTQAHLQLSKYISWEVCVEKKILQHAWGRLCSHNSGYATACTYASIIICGFWPHYCLCHKTNWICAGIEIMCHHAIITL